MTTRRTAALATCAALLTTGVAVAGPAHAATARHYANCTALHRDYPHGVGKRGAHDRVSGHTRPVTTFYVSTALYSANSGSDRDHDGVACEKR